MKQTFSKFDVIALTGLALGLREFVPYTIETIEAWTKYSSSRHRESADDIGMYGYDIESAVFRGTCRMWLPVAPYVDKRPLKWPNLNRRIYVDTMIHGRRAPTPVYLFAWYRCSEADYLPSGDSAQTHSFTLWWKGFGRKPIRIDFGYMPEKAHVYRSDVEREVVPDVIQSWLEAAH